MFTVEHGYTKHYGIRLNIFMGQEQFWIEEITDKLNFTRKASETPFCKTCIT